MKQTHFAGMEKPLHANELHQQSESQLFALASFFKIFPFCRVAAVITNKTTLSQTLKPYQVAAAVLLKRIGEVARWHRITKIAVIIEQSDRGDKSVKKYFDGFSVVARSNAEEFNIPLQFYLMPKAASEPGPEVADFIMHAAGTQTRERIKGTANLPRKDFAAVFKSVDRRLVSFLEVNEAIWNDA